MATLVTTDSELTIALDTLGGSGGPGGTIILATAGVFASNRVIAVTPVAQLIVAGDPRGPRVPLPTVVLEDGARNICFQHLILGDPAASTGRCLLGPGAEAGRAKQITVIDCEFCGVPLDPQGDYSGGLGSSRDGIGGRFENLEVRACYFHDLLSAVKPVSVRGYFRVKSGNLFDKVYMDCVFSGQNLDGPNEIDISDNFFSRPLALLSDLGAPHADAIQVTTSAVVIQRRARLVGNVFCDGGSRGNFHHMLIQGAATYLEMRISDSLHVVDNAASHAPSVEGGGSSVYAARIRVLRRTPGTGSGTSVTSITNAPAGIPSILCDSFGESQSVIGSGCLKVGCSVVPNDPANYASIFVGPFGGDLVLNFDSEAGLKAAKAALVAAYEYKIGGPGAHLRGAYDYAPSEPPERSWIGLAAFPGVPTNTVIETGLLPIMGGGAGQEISVPAETSYRIADDASGENLTSYATLPGVVSEGQYVELKRRSSLDASSTVTYGCTVGGQEYIKNITTESLVSFARIDNQAAAYSKVAAPPSEMSQRKLVVMLQAKLDSFPNFSQLLAQGGVGNTFHIQSTFGKPRIRFVNSSTINAVLDGEADFSDWHNWYIAIDLTKTVATEVLTVYVDDVLQTFAGTVVNTGTAVFNPNSVLADLGILAEGGDGGNLADGGVSALLMDWGPAAYDISWFHNPAARRKFNAYEVGTQGEGVKGAAVKRLFHGPVGAVDGSDPNTWNAAAGLLNRGLISESALKMAGTYLAVP